MWYRLNPNIGMEKVVSDGNLMVRGDTLIIRHGLKIHEGYFVCEAWNCKNRKRQCSTIRLTMVQGELLLLGRPEVCAKN